MKRRNGSTGGRLAGNAHFLTSIASMTGVIALLVLAMATKASPTSLTQPVQNGPSHAIISCKLSYSATSEARRDYGVYITESLSRLTEYTGVTFVEQESPVGASMAFETGDGSEVGPNVVGLSDYDMGTVILAPWKKLRNSVNEDAPYILPMNLITHEVMHTLGVPHLENGRQIMNQNIRSDSIDFGPADLQALQSIRSDNNC